MSKGIQVIIIKQSRSIGSGFVLMFYVGAKGFEPSTPCSQSRCASRTAPYPEKKDDSASSSFFRGEGGIRTPGTHCWIRQFSKLLVSATHPPLLGVELRCKSRLFSDTRKCFLPNFFNYYACLLIFSMIVSLFLQLFFAFNEFALDCKVPNSAKNFIFVDMTMK